MTRQIILSFKLVLFAFILILITSTTISFMALENSNIVYTLSVSRETPWGIITSIFSNNTFVDLKDNMFWLSFFLFTFAITNSLIQKDNIERRSIFVAITIFSAAIISNIFWLLISKFPATGSSGMVFASGGVTLVFAFVNVPKLIEDIKSRKKMGIAVIILFFVFIGIGIILYSVAIEVINFTDLMAKQKNASVHLLSFVISLLFAFLYVTYPRNQKRD
jgi:membrane associated rhomboid family serine protease